MLTGCTPLVALPSAVRLARCFAAKVLADLGLPELAETAQLLASELVTNSVQATGLTTERPSWSDIQRRGTLVSLCIYRTPEHGVVLEVWDSDRRPPVRRQAGLDDEGGRGLGLVEALSREWGYRWPVTGGKVVWCEIAAEDRFTQRL